jgi:putative redox protein
MPVESTKRIERLAFQVSVSGHELIADVPEKLGGTNKGPDPHDYLQAALAACTAITVQMYANRKAIPLESVDVKVRIVREGPENQIHREVKLIGPLDEDQKKRLLEIAEKCPIHHFLVRGAKIDTDLTS